MQIKIACSILWGYMSGLGSGVLKKILCPLINEPNKSIAIYIDCDFIFIDYKADILKSWDPFIDYAHGTISKVML